MTEPDTILRLYITGASPHSLQAVTNIQAICERYLRGHYQLDIIDVYQQPELAMSIGIIAAPTLIREQPLPRKTLIGDLANTAKVLRVLNIEQPEA